MGWFSELLDMFGDSSVKEEVSLQAIDFLPDHPAWLTNDHVLHMADWNVMHQQKHFAVVSNIPIPRVHWETLAQEYAKEVVNLFEGDRDKALEYTTYTMSLTPLDLLPMLMQEHEDYVDYVLARIKSN